MGDISIVNTAYENMAWSAATATKMTNFNQLDPQSLETWNCKSAILPRCLPQNDDDDDDDDDDIIHKYKYKYNSINIII